MDYLLLLLLATMLGPAPELPAEPVEEEVFQFFYPMLPLNVEPEPRLIGV
ncbi:MAG: hypothetical protein HQL47_09680 [Gammaproteobacteria bacterium]|nr:hypothetical protein [Gammaproteobacteria bacterium]